MGYVFRPAVRDQTSLLIGLAGPSGSGKTVSALKVARGIMGGKDEGIFFIDTEAGRSRHYACSGDEKPGPFRFSFQHLDMPPPFSPEAYQAAIATAIQAGAKVVIVDSMSHEHEGEGGILEQHEVELTKMSKGDFSKRDKLTFAAWIKPKASHNKFVNFILQQKCHFIFCFRAKDKMKLVKKPGGGMEPVQLGWTPICSDRFEYEMTTLLMMPPNARGVPDLSLDSTKVNAHHLSFFREGEPIGEKVGEQLAAWARGGATSAPPAAPAEPAMNDKVRAIVEVLGWWADDARAGVLKTASTKVAGNKTFSIGSLDALRAMPRNEREEKWLDYTFDRLQEARREAEESAA